MRRCDNCGRLITGRPFAVRIRPGRFAFVCDDCLTKLARGVAMVERVAKRAAA